jgi:hypothetical protein
MKFKFLKSSTIGVILLNSSLAYGGIISSGFGVNGNFIDKGNITTEYRADGTVWEWLDLTVTNGISVETIKADIKDNGIIDNSINEIGVYRNAFIDIEALSESDAKGWKIESVNGAQAMLNNYFGLTIDLTVNDRYSFGANTTIVESFILLFGDTVHEALVQFDELLFVDANPSLPNIGSTRGYTSMYDVINRFDDFGKYTDSYDLYYFAVVDDGQFSEYLYDDSVDDSIYLNRSSVTRRNVSGGTGTWLTRQVMVPEPSILAIFALGLMGIASRRLKKQS